MREDANTLDLSVPVNEFFNTVAPAIRQTGFESVPVGLQAVRVHAQQKQTRNEQSPRPRKLVCLRCTRIVREHSQIFKPRLRHASVKPVLWPLIRLTRIDGSTFFFPLKFLDTYSRRSEVFGTLARQADSRRCFLQELGNKLLRASRYPLSRLPRAGHANWTRLRLAYLRLFCTRAISAL